VADPEGSGTAGVEASVDSDRSAAGRHDDGPDWQRICAVEGMPRGGESCARKQATGAAARTAAGRKRLDEELQPEEGPSIESPRRGGCSWFCQPAFGRPTGSLRRADKTKNTWAIGTFYFAGNRNFLFCVDTFADS
jgi:hypothetical protein